MCGNMRTAYSPLVCTLQWDSKFALVIWTENLILNCAKRKGCGVGTEYKFQGFFVVLFCFPKLRPHPTSLLVIFIMSNLARAVLFQKGSLLNYLLRPTLRQMFFLFFLPKKIFFARSSQVHCGISRMLSNRSGPK